MGSDRSEQGTTHVPASRSPPLCFAIQEEELQHLLATVPAGPEPRLSREPAGISLLLTDTVYKLLLGSLHLLSKKTTNSKSFMSRF